MAGYTISLTTSHVLVAGTPALRMSGDCPQQQQTVHMSDAPLTTYQPANRVACIGCVATATSPTVSNPSLPTNAARLAPTAYCSMMWPGV